MSLRLLSLTIVVILLFAGGGFASALYSTIGVGYISRFLEIQDRERAPASVQVAAARDVLRRVLPHLYSSFEFRIIPKESCNGDFCFIIKNHPFNGQPGAPEILISGVTGVEIVAGLHWYLKYRCASHFSWDKTGGFQTPLLLKSGCLPRVQDAGMVVRRPVPWNYYQNAVTSSYTFAWWDWERWEKEIDWMALQGINLPLAFTGQESIWQKVFLKFNISTEELDDFFGGPAFLAWSRMANLHGWGGPLQQSWLDQQLLLQKRILARMYELGMTPVLPAFSGSIPAAVKQKFPSAKITRLGNWFSVDSNPRWCCTYLLDATDPLFVEIGRAFIEEQIKEYGRTGHIYNCDTFDENTPPVDDPGFISSLGAATYEGMKSGDPDAVWLMQGWLFSYDPFWRPPQMKALLHSVPLGRMVVLDLFAEVKPIWSTSEQFYGVPYIWCMLHNFAGNVEMYGVLDSIASGPVEARTSENSTMVGVGMSMEGIEQNPVVYDLMSEMAFQTEKVDAQRWINLYSARRYGQIVPSVSEAWNILYHTIYNCTDGLYDKNRDVIVAFPDVDPSAISFLQLKYQHGGKLFSHRAVSEDDSNLFDQPHLWYSTTEVIRALKLFLVSGEYLQGSSCYRYDLVDLTRQALAKYANQLFVEIIEDYQLKDAAGVNLKSEKFLALVEDLDTLLACHEGFLLGPWLESAKRLGQNEEQRKQYEWNARTQITMWYDNTEEEASLLRDYGNKYWNGLLKDYYLPRAAIYFDNLKESLEKGHNFQLKKWRREWIKLTNNWQNSRSVFPIKSSGHALKISQQLYNKYLSDF
ncbi:hypothetical protein MLD38_039456 [Melastoma candidum]|uniref:Uncharacterized protein n=1 Tax=Melastoma candidum TaxID=119954 RepID=A0ACB9L2V3_9MYRT|nr:hypothetical protein MLD38_039456 [Melastoma candidum]